MERDAISPNPATLEVVPPVAWETTRTVAFVGLGLCGAAAVLGLVAYGLGSDSPWVIDTARLALVFAGAVTTGLAISFRAELWQVWAIGTGSANNRPTCLTCRRSR